MLGSTSICMYHLETEHLLLFVSNRNVSIDVSVLSHGLPNLVESRAPALLLGTSFQQGPAFGLSSKPTAGLILQQNLIERLAFKYHPPERTIPCFLMDCTTLILLLSCLFRSGERKDRTESNTARQVF